MAKGKTGLVMASVSTISAAMCILSREAQIIIRDFGRDKYGEPLSFPNAAGGKKS